MEFDNLTRSLAFGFENSEQLYKAISSQPMIKFIKVPFLVIHMQDDPIVLNEHFPRQEILSNQNGLLIEGRYGGHCGLLSNS